LRNFSQLNCRFGEFRTGDGCRKLGNVKSKVHAMTTIIRVKTPGGPNSFAMM
jgi:hypothetical protein